MPAPVRPSGGRRQGRRRGPVPPARTDPGAATLFRADRRAVRRKGRRVAARGDGQRQDRDIHQADRRRTACGPQRAVHVARDRANRPADRADEGSFRRCGDRVPFPADRQPSGGRLPPPDRRKRRPARRGRSLIGAAAAPPPVVGDRRRGTREQFQAGRFGSPVSRARYGRHARGALRRQDAAGQRDAFGRVLF